MFSIKYTSQYTYMRKRSEDTRKTIITAARQLLLASGYAATSVDAIAVQANVTKRTVYGYFPDKRALFMGVVEDAVGDPWEFHVPPQTIVTPDGLYHALYAIAAGLNDITAHPDYVQLLRVTIAEIPAQPDLSVLFERGVTRRSLRTITSLLKTAADHELLTVPDPEAAARQFVGGFVVRTLLDGLLQPEPKLTKLTSPELTAYVELFTERLKPGGQPM